MTSKKIIAFMLTVCMLLTCMPAFAATVELNDVEFPEDGTISVVATRTIWESITVGESARNVLIILNDDTSTIFPYRATANHYNGLTVSFTATCKNEVMGDDITTFTVVDAPVNYARADGGGRACFGVSVEDLIAYSPELSALDESKFTYTMQESPFTISELFVKKGTWTPGSVDTGAFPEGTIFLSYQEFLKYPSTYDLTGGYGFTNLIYKNTRATAGPYQFFVPETTGEYNIYVQLISNNASLDDRAVKLSVDGKEMNFKPGDYEASKLPTSMVPMWCYETAGKTVDLTKDEVVAVQLNGGAYGRITAVAMVPVASNAEISAAINDSPTTLQVPTDKMTAVAAKAYHPNFASGAINVTINGEAVALRAGMAAKKTETSYLNAGLPTYGLSVRILPETNTFPTYPTVLDAVAKYMLDKGNDSPFTASSIQNGAIANNSFFVNGSFVTDIDWCEIKEGDVITYMAKDNKNSFDPTSIKGFQNIDTNGAGLIQAIGTPTKEDAYDETGKLKLCLNQANTASALGSFAIAYDETGLKDCYLVGYLTMRKDNTNVGDSWTDLDPTAKVYFENIPILGYDTSPNASRVDLVTGGKIEYSPTDPRYKNANNEAVQNEDGKWLVKPYHYHGDPYLYNWSNVYLVNCATDVSLKAAKSANGYTLTTGGMHVVDVVIATYAEDGKTVTNTEIMKEQIVMFNDSLNIPVAANQKAFVWGTKIYGGTTMKPALAPLVGSNFAN